ncbi:hypothetical protein [Phormidium tenue]|uniref:DUF3153 domain-containing protein n=1 Tax=Phormidium tenue NIES-30 TaxID=549789 RepID=A0A1U7J746_9CYAN|nr:hypothetical protein [Phormidium tenue]MBD2233630.1 hypothetical protein [Phormidium tenue FACHB-1052]OKH48727.1 hypothetical protein NIES30_09310 [Phormidium tenue NIES-30]
MIISRLKGIGLLVLALVACAACQTTLPSGSSPLSEATTLTLEATAQGNGEFALVGTTNLPNDTQLTAIALRHLLPEGTTAGDRPLYSVLDYQPVTVANGQWSAQLSLWQVAADGRYQEPWQAEADALGLVAQPSKTVQFAIALAPHHLGAALGDKLAQNRQRRLATVLRVTPDGDPFLWADQALSVALPSGQTTPSADLLARTNGGWGDRYLLVPEPPLPYTLTPADERQTTAPLSPDELLR